MSFIKPKRSGDSSSTGDSRPFFGVQAKLKIGKSNDKYEQEADSVADKVVKNKGLFGEQPFFAPKPTLRNQSPIQLATEPNPSTEESEMVQEKPLKESISPLVQKTEQEEDLQQKSENQGGDTSHLERQLSNSKGGGSPMEPETKSQMESGFGADFGDVRIHNDSNAIQMNKNLGAKAFANGNDIYFNEGHYNPSSKEGQHLLAHELTHTIQQGGGKNHAQTKPDIQLSPLSDELSQMWTTQGKGAFYNRLRQVSPLSDPDIAPFVATLQGDDHWLTQNIITHGRESNWPIHLKVEREMKGWGDSGGKGVVFEILRAANATETANANLTASLNRVFGPGTDDIWLATNLQQYGREASWPIHLRVEREMKGWGDSGGKGVVFDILRVANGSEVSNANLSTSFERIFGAGTQDIWLARLLQQYGVESRWPIQLRIQRDLKGWQDSGGFAAVVASARAATVPDRQTALTDRETLSIIHSNLSQAEGTVVVSELLVGSQNWDNPPATDFYAHFVLRRGNGAIPTNRTMNCWESILYSAHLAGHVSADWIHNYYVRAGAVPGTTANPTPRLWAQLGFSTSLPIHNPGAGNVPALGQLVFYLPTGASIPSHVALSVGNNEVISLWTEPNNIHSVQRIAIDSISGTIHYGNPPW